MAGAGGGGRDEPNLELPSFFGRRKKRQDAEEPSGPAPVAPEAGTEPDHAPTPTGGLRPVARAKRVPPPRREQPAPEQPAATQPVAAPVARREPAPEPVVEPVAEPVATPAPVAEPAPAPTPEPAPRGPEMTYAAEPTTVLTAPPPDAEDDTGPSGADDEPGRPRRSLPSISLPRLHPWLAAAVGGAVAALVGVVLAWLSLRGCEAVRGVSSCGGGPGLLLLVTVVVAEVLVGAAVLRALGSEQPAGTSLVGVGLVVVLAMFFPAVAVTSVAAAIVLPIATALTFVLAHVAATTVVDLGD